MCSCSCQCRRCSRITIRMARRDRVGRRASRRVRDRLLLLLHRRSLRDLLLLLGRRRLLSQLALAQRHRRRRRCKAFLSQLALAQRHRRRRRCKVFLSQLALAQRHRRRHRYRPQCRRGHGWPGSRGRRLLRNGQSRTPRPCVVWRVSATALVQKMASMRTSPTGLIMRSCLRCATSAVRSPPFQTLGYRHAAVMLTMGTKEI